jgi:polar amino acid transport system substrate-binding protein
MPAASQPFRIVHNDSLPPLVGGVDGKSVGYAIDIVRAAAGRSGLDVTFMPAAIDQQIPTITGGGADAVLSANTPERRESLDFSDPVVMTGGALYVLSPRPTPDTLLSLAGKTVVTPRTGPLAGYIKKAAPEIQLVVTKNYEESLARVIGGEADAAALNFLAGGRIANRLYAGRFTLPTSVFYEQPFAVGVPKGCNAATIAKINAGLTAIRADGAWQKISDHWTKV